MKNYPLKVESSRPEMREYIENLIERFDTDRMMQDVIYHNVILGNDFLVDVDKYRKEDNL